MDAFAAIELNPIVLGIGLTLGLIVGLLAGWLIARGRAARELAAQAAETGSLAEQLKQAEARKGELREELASADAEAAQLRDRLERSAAERAASQSEAARIPALVEETERLREELTTLKARGAELLTQLEAQREVLAKERELFAEAKATLSDHFQALASKALETGSAQFLEMAKGALAKEQQAATGELEQRKQAVENLVKPIGERLQKLDETVHAIEKSRSGAHAQMLEQITMMRDFSGSLRDETSKLVQALRKPKVRGDWGELQLERVVEMAGMLDHCDFTTQVHVATEGRAIRPDMIVHLPGGKTVVVDAKTPMESYLNALDAPDDETRERYLTDHARQVRDKMRELSGKSYASQFESAPEFVVMFLPGEAFFSAALEKDPALIEESAKHGVIPASPTTLIALLKAVAYGWRQETLAENARAIAAQGAELYERLGAWLGHVAKMGKGLEGAVTSYNQAVGSLQSRVLVTARKFPELGVESKAELPDPQTVDTEPRPLQAPEAIAEIKEGEGG